MAYEVLNPKDGETLGARFVKGREDAENPALVFDSIPEGAVWDASAGAPRPRTDAEMLVELKAAKTDEFAQRAIDDLAPLFTDGKGRDETVLLVAGHVLKLCEALNVPPDPRLREVAATGEKALRLKAEIGAAGSAEELEGVSWAR